ncbi:trans-Golgi network-localized SYP41-interacting protein 1-like isoform X3 [Gossypium arboreum]|nr:trans-Golgi network-localized SYP41-interacting protein 1-like isoform X3 [Gossypium arboreum]
MQETDGLGMNQLDRGGEAKFEVDGRLTLSGHGECDEPLEGATPGVTSMEGASNETEEAFSRDASIVSTGASSSSWEDGSLAASSQLTNEQAPDVIPYSPVKEEQEMCPSFSDYGEGNSLEGNQQYLPEVSFVSEDLGHERSLQMTRLISSNLILSLARGGTPVKLSQLVEAIRSLDEDEYRLLLNSHESVSLEISGTDNLSPSYHPDIFEKLKEELYLTSFSKDIFYLKLSEQSDLHMESERHCHQLLDEISLLHSSINKVHETNACLGEELAQCRSELQISGSGREELQNELNTALLQIEEFSSRANELQSSLVRSQEDLSSLFSELSEYKNQVATLQADNVNLNRTVYSLTDERSTIAQEKESSLLENEKLLLELARYKDLVITSQVESEQLNMNLASLTEERKALVDEKMLSLQENEKLRTELADCKSLISALQVEHSNIINLAIMSEERIKLEEEKELLAQGKEKAALDLEECKDLLASLQLEKSKLNGELAFVTEERKKLEEDKDYFIHENERLASELLVLQEQLTRQNGEQMQLEAELKVLTVHLEKLMEENSFLNASLDVHKAKLVETDSRGNQNIEAGSQVKGLGVSREVLENAANYEPSCFIPLKQDPDESTVVSEKLGPNDVVGGSSLVLLEQEVFDDSSGFLVLKGHLKEAERILQNLEMTIEQMHSHSVSLQHSISKSAAPGVSNLTKASEPQVHHDEPEVERRDLPEYQLLGDLFNSTKEVTENLRALLKLLGQDADDASFLYRGERDCRKSANFTFQEHRVLHETLKEYSDILHASNIELGVLYEASKQHAYGIEAKYNELKVLHEALKQQESSLSSENAELGKKLSEYQLKLTEMQSQFSDLKQRSDDTTSALNQQFKNSQKEAAERALMPELELRSMVTQIVETVRRLDLSVGQVSNFSFSDNSSDISDLNSRLAISVDSAINNIRELQEQLEIAHAGHDAILNSYKEVDEKYNDLHRNNEFMVGMLHELYNDLKKLVIDSCVLVGEPEMNTQVEKLPDPLDYSKYKILIEQLENVLGERLQLQSVNDQLNLEMMNRTRDVVEMRRECLHSNAIQKLIEQVENVVKLDDSETDSDRTPGSHLELLVCLLVKKYKDIDQQVSNRGEDLGSKMFGLTEVEEKIHQLDALRLQQEFEILTLKESLRQKEEALQTAHSELLKKVSEIEQSEQRVSSVREKLSIAVAKGKGLVVQRDGLKQSLAETSAELERLSQELQVKDAQLQELEIKLKTYSEAGERVEALESELSYIRNSATALRESFLLKDSVLQRIEEILEDLDLPEHFHSRDIIEKVDWLARSTTDNSLPAPDWEQKSSVGGSYSDAGFVTVDTWKEDAQPTLTSGDDWRRKYEDLESKFYGLAEQNEMLEQSLMERNHLVQRWEELLGRIDMPSQMRSIEPEEKIEWLGGALSEANHDKNSLQKKIDDLQNYFGSVAADLEESEKRISDLDSDLQSVALEREHLSERLDALTSDNHNLAAKATQFEVENEKLQIKVSGLKEELDKRIEEEEENLLKMEGEIRRLQYLVCDVLQDPEAKDLGSGGSSTASLEGLLKKLIENYTNLKSVNPEPVDIEIDQTKLCDPTLDQAGSRDALTSQEDVASLKKELEEVQHDLMQAKEERDEYFGKHQSLLHEVQALERKGEELQGLLNQEEQKSAFVREKLNVAVRKGKSLVQQRDGLKKTIEEMNAELERLKSELSNQENALADYELKMRDFSTYPQKVEALEADNLFLRNHLTETERMLEEKRHTLNGILNAIADIDAGVEIDTFDPVEKLGQIGKVCHDLHASVSSSKQESQKSKRAAELLLAELNEVQERNDGLQEDLAKISVELTEVTKDREVAEAAKLEVLSRLEELSTVHSEGKRKQYSELMMLQSCVNEVTKGFNDIQNLLYIAFMKDLEFLQNLEVNIKLCLEGDDAQDVAGLPYSISSDLEDKVNFQSTDTSSIANIQEPVDDNAIVEVCSSIWHHLQDLTTEITALKEKFIGCSKSLHERGYSLWNVVGILHRERNSQNESFEDMRRNIMHLESIGKEKDMEIVVLRRNVALLYEACANLVLEIENGKAELLGNSSTTADLELAGALALGGQNRVLSEEQIKTMADKLLSTMKDFLSMKYQIAEGSQREMKITVENLRKDLQEKDIQKDQICAELVGQIKLAEAAAMNYSRDLQSSKTLVHDLEKELEVVKEENKSVQQRVKELQDVQANSVELHDRVKSLTDVLSSKDQEIEALMQALDEEEVQMEELTKKNEELEKVLQQKNIDLENLEASHGKVVKKLSITVSKFDELRDLSQSLLIKIEQLQSELQDRDAEISFLRQEVTRCTNDLLAASQMNSKRESNEIHEFLTWFEGIVSCVGLPHLHFDMKDIQVPEYKEIIQKKLSSITSELENLRVAAQSKDELLQAERTKVEELTRMEETLKKTLQEKESLLNLLEGAGDVDHAASANSEIVQVEPVINQWAVPGNSSASQVRSLRKVNNDQVAIHIDSDDVSNSRLEDEDEDKVHGFKSLTTSRIVPRFTRPVSDMIDGLWVSCDRALMRQPALRLAIMIYWAILHSLLAAFVF